MFCVYIYVCVCILLYNHIMFPFPEYLSIYPYSSMHTIINLSIHPYYLSIYVQSQSFLVTKLELSFIIYLFSFRIHSSLLSVLILFITPIFKSKLQGVFSHAILLHNRNIMFSLSVHLSIHLYSITLYGLRGIFTHLLSP